MFLRTCICGKCQKIMRFETYKDINLVLWANYDGPDYAMCLTCWEAVSEDNKTRIYEKSFLKPQVYLEGKMTRYFPPRLRLAHRVIEYLNRESFMVGHFYDCGELGILDIWWSHDSWQWRWLEPEPLPELLSEVSNA